MAAAFIHPVHPVLRPRKPQPLRIASVPDTHQGRPQQRAGAPLHDGPSDNAPRLREGAWFGGGGSRGQVLDEVLDFLGEGEEQFEDVIRRALR